MDGELFLIARLYKIGMLVILLELKKHLFEVNTYDVLIESI